MKSKYDPFFVLFVLFYYLRAVSNLKITHQDLVHIGTKLGYEGLGQGLCYGFSMMYATAILTHSEHLWSDRLDLLENYKNDANTLCSEIQSIRKKVKKNGMLAPREKALLDVPAFFESLALYQSPNSYLSFFNAKFMRQIDLQRIFQLARPASLEEVDLLIVLLQILTFDDTLLNHYLQRLGSILQGLSLTLPIILHNHNHAVCLTYKHNLRSWSLMNIEDFGLSYTIDFKSNEIDLLAYKIFSGFQDNPHGHSVIAINGIATDADSKWAKVRQCMLVKYPITKNMISQSNSCGIDLLHMSAKFGHLKLVEDILRHHENMNSCSSTYGTALRQAAKFGYVDIVNLLLQCKADLNITLPQKDYSDALHCACEWGHFEIATLLIQYGADVNRMDSQGITPLFKALKKEDSDIMQLLLAHRANLYPNLMMISFRQVIFVIQQLCWYDYIGSGIAQSVNNFTVIGRYLFFNTSFIRRASPKEGKNDDCDLRPH